MRFNLEGLIVPEFTDFQIMHNEPHVSYRAPVGQFHCTVPLTPAYYFTPGQGQSFAFRLTFGDDCIAESRCGLDFFCRRRIPEFVHHSTIPELFRQSVWEVINVADYARSVLEPSWDAHRDFATYTHQRWAEWRRVQQMNEYNDPVGWIYLVGSDVEGFPVKIGYTQNDPDIRVKSLQTGCPHPLVVVDSFKGRASDEKKLHKELDAHRMSGEWFENCTLVMEAFQRFVNDRNSNPVTSFDRFGIPRVNLETI